MTRIIKLEPKKIIEEAVVIADKGGIHTLSMRRLANSLGVEAMSLYHHFANKEELVAAMVDSVVPRLELTQTCIDWQSAMKSRAHLMRDTLVKHPWAAYEFVSGVNVGPNMLAYINTTIGYLREAGFSYQMTDYAWNVIDCYIYGFNMHAQNFPFEQSQYKDAAKHYIHMIPHDTYPYMYDMSQQIINGSYDGIQDFDFGLKLLLDGLERQRKNVIKKERL